LISTGSISNAINGDGVSAAVGEHDCSWIPRPAATRPGEQLIEKNATFGIDAAPLKPQFAVVSALRIEVDRLARGSGEGVNPGRKSS
jgi:hypothetical protein